MEKIMRYAVLTISCTLVVLTLGYYRYWPISQVSLFSYYAATAANANANAIQRLSSSSPVLPVSPVGSQKKFYRCTDQESNQFPHHCHLMESISNNPEKVSKELYEFSKNIGFVLLPPDADADADADADTLSSQRQRDNIRTRSSRKLGADNDLAVVRFPSVLAHGMGDSCFNDGMKKITARVSSLTDNQYATCIPTGENLHEDITNGYTLNMDASIEIFAEKVKADPQLKNGFNAVGFSQGNNLIRGYIARFNDPPVNTFVSVNGVNAGVGALPDCIPEKTAATTASSLSSLHSYLQTTSSSKICNALMEVASHKAYSNFAQKHSFQANYWRDLRAKEKPKYRKFSQLAQLNNEGLVVNSTLNDNYAKTNHFVWVMANQDTVVWPREGEQWGAPNPDDPFNDDIIPMNQTEWYLKDLFGLRTADENGKNHFESFDGNHLEFKMSDFESWIVTYFSI